MGSLSWIAIAGSVSVAALCALQGSFLILQRRSLLVDMLGHAVFPGVVLGYMAAGWQRSMSFFILFALAAVVLSYLLFSILAKDRKVGDDAATAIALSGTFALGTVLLSWVQQEASGSQAGLNTFLTGQAALISAAEAASFAALFIVVAIFVAIFKNPLKMAAFDEEFATVAGVYPKWIRMISFVLVGMSVFLAVRAVGVVLASALFVLAPVAALLWVKKFETLIFTSAAISALCAFVGSYWSALDESSPTGAAVILALFLAFVISWLF